MTKLKSKLAGLLVIQLILAIGLWGFNQPPNQEMSQRPLVMINGMQIDRLTVTDGDQTTTIEMVDGHWQLPQLNNLPANMNKLDELLAKLKNLKTGWATATTSASHERFEVSEDNFQKHLQLYVGEKLTGDLYLGTSPGFRKVHVRQAGESSVYSVKLNSFDIPTSSDEWLDKTLLSAKAISQIKGPDYTLAKTEDNWSFSNPNSAMENNLPSVDEEKAKNLASALSRLTVLKVADNKPKAKAFTLEVSGEENADQKTSWTYQFIEEDGNYYVSRNDIAALFSISKTDYEQITQVGLPDLAMKDLEPENKTEIAVPTNS